MKLNIMKPSEMTDEKPKVYLRNFIPLLCNSVTMIFALGGIAKSFTSIHIAIKLIESDPHLKAALWLTEDSEAENRRRFLSLADTFGEREIGFYNDRVQFIQSEPVRFVSMCDGNAALTKEFFEVKDQLSDYALIVLDPLLSFFGADENSNTYAGILMSGLKSWAAEENKAILLLHHATIVEGGRLKARGARELVNSTRAAYSMSKCPPLQPGSSKADIKKYFESRNIELVKDNGLSAEVIKSYGSTNFTVRVLPPIKELL